MSFIFLGGSIKPPAIASSRSLACNAKLLYPDDDLNPALKESILWTGTLSRNAMTSEKRTGRLFQYIKDSDKAADEAKQEKINYMNEKYAQKQMEKQEEMERKAKRDSILNEVSQ